MYRNCLMQIIQCSVFEHFNFIFLLTPLSKFLTLNSSKILIYNYLHPYRKSRAVELCLSTNTCTLVSIQIQQQQQADMCCQN